MAVADRGHRTVDAGLTITTVNSPPPPALDGTVTAAAQKVAPSTVALHVGASADAANGSAVVVRSDGYLLTNDHVIAPAPNAVTVVLSDGRAAAAKVVGRDAIDDLAVLRITGVGPLTAASFATSSAIGQSVVAVGAPAGLSGTVAAGIVSGLQRPAHTFRGPTFSAIQTSIPVAPGDSGGPLADLDGSVVGIRTQTAQPALDGIGFAIPSRQATRIAAELIATGAVSHAQLGVTTSNVALLDGPGVNVTAVTAGGPAAKAGLRVSDVISQIGGSMITDTDGLLAAVAAAAPGTRLLVRYTRLNTASYTYVVLGRAPR